MNWATVIELGITAMATSAFVLVLLGLSSGAAGDLRARNKSWAVSAVLFAVLGGAAVLLLG